MTEEQADNGSEVIPSDAPENLEPSDAAQDAHADQTMDRDDADTQLDRLRAWRDTGKWLELVEGMRKEDADAIGPALPAEAVALAMYAVRRLGGQAGSLTRSRVLAATRPDADVLMELARATDHGLETVRSERDSLRLGIRVIANQLRSEIQRGERPEVLLILERLESLASL